MINTEDIYHVYPVADTEDHELTCDNWWLGIGGKLYPRVSCICKCNPKIEYQDNGTVIVVHNSFDGREGVEWANEILNR